MFEKHYDTQYKDILYKKNITVLTRSLVVQVLVGKLYQWEPYVSTMVLLFTACRFSRLKIAFIRLTSIVYTDWSRVPIVSERGVTAVSPSGKKTVAQCVCVLRIILSWRGCVCVCELVLCLEGICVWENINFIENSIHWLWIRVLRRRWN